MGPGPGGMFSLNPGSYKFPFQFTLPSNIPPSFEYPFRNRRASLRYIFSAQILSPYAKTVAESYIWIKARPINIPDQIKHENYVTVKNVGIVSRGKSGIALFTMANNYRINDMLPFTIDIYNEECGVQVKEVKISIKRTVTFVKDGKEYQQRTAILRKRYPCLCDKNAKNSYHYDDIQFRDNELKDIDYDRNLNPYPFIDDVNLLMPNIRSKFIKCEYSLKATSYFDLSVLGKNRPRVEMPIYITHQLQKEFDYEKSTNQYNGQGQEFAARDFNRGFNANNNQWGNNNNNNNWNNNNNNNWNNNNNNNIDLNKSKTIIGSKQYSYEAYIASKNLNKPQPNKNNNSWQSKSTFQPSSNFGNNNWNNNNNNPWENNNKNPWENNNNNNSWRNNNNNNPWDNNNNNYNNNNPWNNNNNNNNWRNNNNNGQNRYGSGFNNGSANPFEGGNNDFPTLDKINSRNNQNNQPNPFGNNNNAPSNPFRNNNNDNNNYPPNPFGNNNNSPPNPFGNNNNAPSNPFRNNNNQPPNPFGNNNNQPSNPFGGNSAQGPYQNSYPSF